MDVEAKTDKVEGQVVGAFDDAGKKAGSRLADGIENEGGSRMGGTAAKLGTMFAGAMAGAAALEGTVSMMKGFADAARESEKVGKATNAVLEATGGVAGITADHVGKLTDSLSKKAGMDDEAIQSGQNLLLKFTNLRNEVDDGNGVYDRTTALMVDMAAAMGTDPVSAATKLGKALNEPGEGLSRLKKEGVTFTEEQEKVIQAMADTGDTAGAQRAILDALEGKYKGMAESQATATDRMQVAWGNIQEEIGARLLPAFESLSTWAVEVGLPALMAFIDWVGANVIPIIEQVFAGIQSVISAAVGWWRDNWEQIRAGAETVLGAIRQVIEGALGAIEAFWRTWGGTITTFVEGLWNGIRQQIEGALTVIQGVINVIMGLIRGDFSRVWEGIREVFRGAWEVINGLVDQATAYLRLIVEGGMRLVAGALDAAWSGIKAAAGAAWDALRDFASGAIDRIVDGVSSLPGRVVSFAGNMLSAGLDLGRALVNGIVDGVKAIPGLAGDFASAFADAVKGVVNSQIIDRINSTLEFKIPVPFGPDIPIDPPDIPHLHTGGIVPGRVGSEVPAMLLGGEGVFTRDQMRALGLGLSGVRGGGDVSVSIIIGSFAGTTDNARELAAVASQHVARVMAKSRAPFDLRGAR